MADNGKYLVIQNTEDTEAWCWNCGKRITEKEFFRPKFDFEDEKGKGHISFAAFNVHINCAEN
ncbi:MAG: hypothetical protein ACYS76_16290 [Planctomycetota bacterium]|jgi:hypothetical protein